MVLCAIPIDVSSPGPLAPARQSGRTARPHRFAEPAGGLRIGNLQSLEPTNFPITLTLQGKDRISLRLTVDRGTRPTRPNDSPPI